MSDSANGTLAVELRDIHKEFYGVKANEGVDFQLRRGEVHADLHSDRRARVGYR